MTMHVCTIREVEAFRPVPTDDPRPGYVVLCDKCGPLADGWAYWRLQDARAKVTRHSRTGES